MKTLRWFLAVGLSVSAAFAAWKEGDRVEALSYSTWYPAKIIEVDSARWKVSYDGYTSSSDEWLTAEKIRELPKAPWKTGDRIEAFSGGKWYPGKIVESEVAKWKVTYDGYGSNWDEWLKFDRIRLPAATTAVAAADGTAKPAAAGDPKATTFSWPVRPDGAKSGLQGAWLRMETYYWSGSLSFSNYGWFFTKSGRVSRAPSGGFDFAEFEKAEKAGKEDGVYWITGDKITIRWADGSKDWEYTFARKGNEITLDGIGGTPVEPFKRSWRLDGEYEGGASLGGGALASSSTVVFRKDGTFARSSISSFKSTGDTTQVSGGSQSEAVGTYEFDGYTLTLKLNDGTATRYTVFAFGDKDGEGRPEYIYRDGTMMRNQAMKRASK
ncbi:MAG: agenet domain-containing protein [Rariglobus sp.]